MKQLWNCQTASQANDLTVGQKFELHCQGPTEGIHFDKLEIKKSDLSDEIPAMTLLSVQSAQNNQTTLVVTSYRVGAHKSSEIIFTDGETQITPSDFEWNLKSVLSTDPSQQQQPYPPFPMIGLSYPVWFWVLLAALLAAIIVGPYFQFLRFKNRKKQFEDLKNLESALNPFDVFFKEMRKLEKTLDKDSFKADDFVENLQKDFRIFLSRSFQLPIHLWNLNQSLKEIHKKYPKVYRDHGGDLKKYFNELFKKEKNLTQKDCNFLLIQAQKMVEAVDASLEKYYRRDR